MQQMTVRCQSKNITWNCSMACRVTPGSVWAVCVVCDFFGNIKLFSKTCAETHFFRDTMFIFIYLLFIAERCQDTGDKLWFSNIQRNIRSWFLAIYIEISKNTIYISFSETLLYFNPRRIGGWNYIIWKL